MTWLPLRSVRKHRVRMVAVGFILVLLIQRVCGWAGLGISSLWFHRLLMFLVLACRCADLTTGGSCIIFAIIFSLKELSFVITAMGWSLFRNGQNMNELQLACCGCAACKHWQRPSYISKYMLAIVFVLVALRAREKMYMHALYVSALRPWEYADSSTSHKQGSEAHSYFGWPQKFSGRHFCIC